MELASAPEETDRQTREISLSQAHRRRAFVFKFRECQFEHLPYLFGWWLFANFHH